MSKNRIEHSSERRMPWYREGEFWTIVGVGAFAVSIVGSQVWAMEIREDSDKKAATFTEQMKDPVSQDGFTLLSVAERINGKAEGSIQITPNCSFDDIEMHVDRTPDGKVLDVTDYSVSTVLNGTVSYRYNPSLRRHESVVTGTPVTLTFTNKEDLMQNVLGELPCATLAQNVTVINENR